MAALKCIGTTRAGVACKWSRWEGRELCLVHAAQAGDVDAKVSLRARSAAGGRAALSPVLPVGSMRTVADLQALAESIISEVRNSRGEAIPKANAVEKLARLCLELLKAGELEQENSELRRTLAELAPERAKAFLKAVR